MITDFLSMTAGSGGGVSVTVIQNLRGWFKNRVHPRCLWNKLINRADYKPEHQWNDQDNT